jgi:hypothetical protein
MKFKVEFQYRPKESARPYDYVQTFDMAGDQNNFVAIPAVGDHVHIESDGFGKGEAGASICIVESRTFFYTGSANDPYCAINIVLTDSDADPGRLIKS